MPEFISRRQPSQLAALIAQMQASQMDPIAQGILQAGKGIGEGLASRRETVAKASEAEKARLATEAGGRESGLMGLLEKGGTFTSPTGEPMTIQSLLPNLGLPTGARYIPPADKRVVNVTPEIIANYPKIANMGYQPGDAIPNAVFLAQTKTEKPKGDKAPPGFRFVAGGEKLEAIPGGPAAEKRETTAQKIEDARNAAQLHSTNVIDAATKAIGIIGMKTTGVPGAVLSKVPGSSRKALEGYIDTLRSNLAFGRLQEMRDNSKTGGALGQVSNIELQLLSSTATSLDPNQPADVLKENIAKVQSQYKAILDKLQGGPRDSDIMTIIDSSGKEHKILEKNIEAAKKRDPGLKIKE